MIRTTFHAAIPFAAAEPNAALRQRNLVLDSMLRPRDANVVG
jgi:hypothetical protein